MARARSTCSVTCPRFPFASAASGRVLAAEGREVDLVLLAVKLDGDAAELARRVEGVVRAG